MSKRKQQREKGHIYYAQVATKKWHEKHDKRPDIYETINILFSSLSQAYLGNSHLCPYIGELVLVDLCPIIHNIVVDGLRASLPIAGDSTTPTKKPPTTPTAWTVVERSAHAQSHAHAGQIARTFEDLVRFINHVTDDAKVSPLEKFYTFVLGLLK